MNSELEELAKKVDRIEKSIKKLSVVNNDECIKKITVSLEEVLNSRSRDTKLNVIITLLSVLITVAIFFGVYIINTLYELAVW